MSVTGLIGVKTDTVVLNSQAEESLFLGEVDLNLSGLGMFLDVMEDFFKDEEEMGSERNRQGAFVPADFPMDFAGDIAELPAGEVFEAFEHLAEGVEFGIDQPDDIADGLGGGGSDALDFGEFWGGGFELGDAFGGPSAEQLDAAEIAAGFVVKVVGDAQAKGFDLSRMSAPKDQGGDDGSSDDDCGQQLKPEGFLEERFDLQR